MQPIPSCTAMPVSILILAGGRALRMEGQDKGLVTLEGQTLAERIHQQALSSIKSLQCNDIIINTNRNQQQYAALFPHAQIIADSWPDFRGPLAGIHAGLSQCQHDWLWVIPCDLYQLPEHCLTHMQQTLEKIGQQNLYATYAVINDDALYPLCLVHKKTLDPLANALHKQQYAVRHWLFDLEALPTYFKIPAHMPLNLNTPEALQAAADYRQQLSGGDPSQVSL